MEQKFFENALRILDARIQGIEEIHANGISSAFTDEQTEKLDKRIDDRIKIHLGEFTLRVFMLAVGTLVVAAVTAILVFFGIRK